MSRHFREACIFWNMDGIDRVCACVQQVRLQTGLLARCMAQSRLNYLLPAFAAEGLVVAALHAETRRARRAPSSPATGTKQTRKKAQTSGVVYTRCVK
jgi:hypothetical protein